MNIPLEIKKRIAYSYYGCVVEYHYDDKNVRRTSRNYIGSYSLLPSDFEKDSFCLLVKPLSAISKEDAIEIYLGNTIGFSFKEKTYLKRCSFSNNMLSIEVSNVKYPYLKEEIFNTNNLDAKRIDFLRSKGYATRYLNYSVEDLVKAGIYKLTE